MAKMSQTRLGRLEYASVVQLRAVQSQITAASQIIDIVRTPISSLPANRLPLLSSAAIFDLNMFFKVQDSYLRWNEGIYG